MGIQVDSTASNIRIVVNLINKHFRQSRLEKPVQAFIKFSTHYVNTIDVSVTKSPNEYLVQEIVSIVKHVVENSTVNAVRTVIVVREIEFAVLQHVWIQMILSRCTGMDKSNDKKFFHHRMGVSELVVQYTGIVAPKLKHFNLGESRRNVTSHCLDDQRLFPVK